MDIKIKIEKRGLCNSLLTYIVTLYIRRHPELRFIQALWSLGIIDGIGEEDTVVLVDRFYEEPYDTLKRIRCRISEVLSSIPKDCRDEDFQINTTHLIELGIIKSL